MKKTGREVIPDKITQKKIRSGQVYDYCVKTMLKMKKKVQIPAPEYNREKAMHIIRELCTHLLPSDGQGLKRVIEELKFLRRCLVSSTTFLTYFKKYKEENILPPISDYGRTNGRNPILNTDKALQVLNTTIYKN